MIPCRKSYDFVTDAWALEFDNTSLLRRAVKTAISSPDFDQIIIACDNPAAKKVLDGLADDRIHFFERDTTHTLRNRSLAYTMNEMEKTIPLPPDGVTVFSYSLAPFTTAETLEEAVNTLLLSGADSAMAVKRINSPIFKTSPSGLLPLNNDDFVMQESNTVYQIANLAIAAYNRNFSAGSIHGNTTAHFEATDEESLFISSRLLFDMAQTMMLKYKKEAS